LKKYIQPCMVEGVGRTALRACQSRTGVGTVQTWLHPALVKFFFSAVKQMKKLLYFADFRVLAVE
jgi:hypothetical protein